MFNGKLLLRQAVAVSVAACAFSVFAADVSGRKMVWAHYVPWLTPDNASQMVERFYDFPQCEVGKDPFRAEILRALDQGIDGFFNDMVAHKGGATSFWDLRPFLKAAEGTPFQFGICLDAKIPVDQQVKELVKMLSTYGDHPNYPKWKDRYVVDTYTYFAWSADEWRAIRKGCADAGYPIWVIANVERGYEAYSDAKLQPYVGLFDCSYYFSNNGAAWTGHKSLERELRETADFCGRHGAAFMPCLWPGYYGGWLNGRCCYYQPFLGFDALLRRYDCARTRNAQWLHVTTWNDHDETTLQTRRLATANPAMVRAMSREFKGLSPARESEIQFAYLRETMVGSLLRFEAVRLPSAEKVEAKVSGRLLDVDGQAVAALEPKTLTGDWQRDEWIVSTTALARSPVLVPEFTIMRNGQSRTVRLPAAFLVTTCLKNPETVKVSEKDRRTFDGVFDLSWKDGVLSGVCTLAGEANLRRAVLYRNELPVTCFTREQKTILPLFFNGQHTIELTVANGRIAQAVKSFETNGAPDFVWNERSVISRRTPGWMRLTARVEAEAQTEVSLSVAGVKRTFRPSHFVDHDVLRAGAGRIRLAPDGTLYDLPSLGACSGALNLSVWSVKPNPTDAFWVEYEFTDGTFAESPVRYPFAASRTPLVRDVIETEVTLEHTSGASGLPDARPFLTPDADLPVRGARVVKAEVSPFCIREEYFSFENAPMERPKLPQRRWPMGPFRLACTLTPLAADGVDHPLLVKNGWNEGPELTLLADGRLKATLCGGSNRGWAAFAYDVVSRQPLARGRKAIVTLVRDGVRFALFVDGVLQQQVDVPPLRVFGNVSPTIYGGVNGTNPTVALLHDLAFAGDPASPLRNERLTLNPLFTDHMVFAAGKPMRIFGTGLGKVTVTFCGRRASAVGTGNGWDVELPACEPGGPFELEIDLDGRRTFLKDVCVGEVFLMAGQSNMQFVLARSSVRPADYADEPLLRCFTVSRVEPGVDFRSDEGWRPCARDEAGRWSTLAYLLGLERVRAKQIPVGMVVCAQGASVLRSWLPESMCAEPRFAIDPKEMHYDFRSPIYSQWNGPGFLYKRMFENLIPYSFSRAVWYQGESDTGPGAARYYGDMLVGMIGRWRSDLKDAALPFTIVQIADLDARRDDAWRGIQAVQATLPGKCEGVDVVRTADISCTNEIHPPDKLPLAKRISALQD